MNNFKYTQEQINNIINCLNQIEIKGRQNILLIETIFQTIEHGELIKSQEEVGDE